MAGVHSILSPSSAHRWLVCTPSARFEEQIPEEESVYAAEGTLAHDLAALILSARSGIFRGSQSQFNIHLNAIKAKVKEHYEKLGEDSEEPFNEMYTHAENYAAFVLDKGGRILIEHTYDLTKFIPCGFGTADATNVHPKTIHVTDFKYGSGVRVTATANKQMMAYALGALSECPDAEEAVLSIYQPRAGGSSTWTISVPELLKWAEEEVAPKGNLAIAGGGDFVAGDHCRFCKARTRCKAFYDMFASMRNISDSREMTDKQRAEVLTNGGAVKSWIEAVSADTLKTLEGGGLVPGFKLVAGDGKRSYKSEDDVVDILLGAGLDSGDIFDAKLYPITKLEKQLGKKRFNELLSQAIIKIPGKPQIAPESDERSAIGATAADEYDNEEDLTV